MSISHYDLVVYNGSPAGIACAVRAAREGLSVLIVNHTPILGGMISNGLCVWDTQYEGKRSPIYDELREAMFAFYRDTYGEDSDQYKTCLPGPGGHSNGNYEPKVAQAQVEKMVSAESAIDILLRHYPAEAVRDGRAVRSVTFAEMGTDGLPKPEGERVSVTADSWADCSYEGDLMAVCGAGYRFGREAISEFNEPHAGKIYVRPSKEPPSDRLAFLGAEHAKLNLREFPGYQEIIEFKGSGEADHRVQAFNWRTMLTNVEENRLPVNKPENYNREYIKTLEIPGVMDYGAPNEKHRVNRPQLVDGQNPYVDGTWEDRKKVMDEHWNAFLGCLYFAGNDESEPEEKRAAAQQWGLPKDEFVENGHRPHEIYVRESRRLEGRYVFTEHDASYNEEIQRAPVHADAIAVTEWYIDVHACTFQKLPGTLHEGKIMLHQETFPGQVPYRAILPKDIDNLLVPLCVSSSHVGWSGIRLEPTWMNIGEAAGFAAALAKKKGVNAADIDSEELVMQLADAKVMLSFFNDVDLGEDSDWIPALQYFAVKGFFPGYNASAEEALDEGTAKNWAAAYTALKAELENGDAYKPMATARKVAAGRGGAPVSPKEFCEMIGIDPQSNDVGPLPRGEACLLMYKSLK
ncbi:MAG: FAD-dependent oxidoreductase [Spirochaetales bacterium]|jgi:hypothetical protein|nr:FAD-dependent oxidoreductase [Spirochaetales bacterium]